MLVEAVGRGEKVQLPGLLSVERVERAARTGRDPQTGATLEIPAGYGVKVTAGSRLKAPSPADRPGGRPACHPGGVSTATGPAQAAARLLRERGQRVTRPRLAVIEALAALDGHPSADTVANAVASGPDPVHRATVYRTLDTLAELGVVTHVHSSHGTTAYHLADGDAHLPRAATAAARWSTPAGLLDAVTRQVDARTGFALEADHVALTGLCADCRSGGPRPSPGVGRAPGSSAHGHGPDALRATAGCPTRGRSRRERAVAGRPSRAPPGSPAHGHGPDALRATAGCPTRGLSTGSVAAAAAGWRSGSAAAHRVPPGRAGPRWS